MKRPVSIAFMVLVVLQGAHSVEEYFGKLWEVFYPARLISGLFSANLQTGFLVFNVLLFVFGIWAWWFPVRKNSVAAIPIIWFWIIIELINGIGHPLWSVYEGTYEPGLITAPLLGITAVYLVVKLTQYRLFAPSGR